MAFLEVVGLGYTLPGKRRLFKDVDFKVASGQRVALIGANGVGKSTLLRIIAGEDREYDGVVRVEGALLYMRQFVASPDTTIRELLLSLLGRGASRWRRVGRGRAQLEHDSSKPRASATPRR